MTLLLQPSGFEEKKGLWNNVYVWCSTGAYTWFAKSLQNKTKIIELELSSHWDI